MSDVKSAEKFYDGLTRELDNIFETVNQHCREIPDIRESVVKMNAQICSIMNPEIVLRLEKLSQRSGELREVTEEMGRVVERQRAEFEEWKKERMNAGGNNQ